MNRTDYASYASQRSAPLRISRRRRRVRPSLLAVLLLVLVAGALQARSHATGRASAETFDASAFAASEATVDELGGPAGREAAGPRVFADLDGLELRLPSDGVLLVGFHEAATAGALAMQPHGHARANENTTKFTLPPDADGPEYVVLSSRGRRQPATSAVDLVMQDDVPVLAPVDGRVISTSPYLLYGTYDDNRIEIVPDDRPDLRLVMIHVEGVVVRPGDVVVGGETIVADTANRFPFGSHIDRYFDPIRWPHVHIELKAAE